MTNLLQILYFDGEESSHTLGFGLPPVNLGTKKLSIICEYASNKIGLDSYLINRCFVRLFPTKYFSGEVGIQLIGESLKHLKKTSKQLNLPFNKKLVVPYVLEEFLS